MGYFPELPLEPEESKAIGYCAHCGEEVFENEIPLLVQEGYIHRECFMEFAENRLGVEYIAEKLGCIVVDGRVYA